MKTPKFIPFLLALAACGSLSAKDPAATIEPAAKTVLEEAIKALGGREAMEKIKTRVVKGEMAMPAQGMSLTLTQTHKVPNKSLTKTDIPGMMQMEQGFDGEKAWSKDNMQGTRELNGAELDQARENAQMFPELEILKNLVAAEMLADAKEGEKTLKVIKVTSKGSPSKTLYFDTDTKLLAKISTDVASGPGGEVGVSVKMSDYQEKDGVKFATKMTVDMMGQKMVMTFKDVQHNVEIDDAIFAMPK